MTVDAAARAIGAVCLWHLRVLAGWLPPRGGAVVRVFAARFELVAIGDRLAALVGQAVPPPYVLGNLGAAWPRVSEARSPDDVRRALASSVWGDPAASDWPAAEPALEARWAGWLGDGVPGAGAWAAGWAALVAARAVALARPPTTAARVDLRRLLGLGWEQADGLTELASRLPRAAAWALSGVGGAEDLWLAEGRWWRRVDEDARAALRTTRPGPQVVAAVAAGLLVDAWRARAALEAAVLGREGVEAFDAVA